MYLTSIDWWRNLRLIVIILTIQSINWSGFLKNVQDLVNQNTLLKEQIEIMNEAKVSLFQIF